MGEAADRSITDKVAEATILSVLLDKTTNQNR